MLSLLEILPARSHLSLLLYVRVQYSYSTAQYECSARTGIILVLYSTLTYEQCGGIHTSYPHPVLSSVSLLHVFLHHHITSALIFPLAPPPLLVPGWYNMSTRTEYSCSCSILTEVRRTERYCTEAPRYCTTSTRTSLLSSVRSTRSYSYVLCSPLSARFSTKPSPPASVICTSTVLARCVIVVVESITRLVLVDGCYEDTRSKKEQ